MSEEFPEQSNQVSTLPDAKVNYQVSGGITVNPTFENNPQINPHIYVGSPPDAPQQSSSEVRRIEVNTPPEAPTPPTAPEIARPGPEPAPPSPEPTPLQAPEPSAEAAAPAASKESEADLRREYQEYLDRYPTLKGINGKTEPRSFEDWKHDEYPNGVKKTENSESPKSDLEKQMAELTDLVKQIVEMQKQQAELINKLLEEHTGQKTDESSTVDEAKDRLEYHHNNSALDGNEDGDGAKVVGVGAFPGSEGTKVTSEVEENELKWDVGEGDLVSVKRGDGVLEHDWTIDEVYEKDGKKYIRARKGLKGAPEDTVDKPADEFLQWQREAGRVKGVDAPPPAEAGEEPKTRWQKVKEWFRHPVHNSTAWIQARGVGRDEAGRPIVPAAVISREETTQENKRDRKWLLVAVPLGALALYALWQMKKNGIDVPFYGNGEDGGSGAEVFPPPGGSKSVDLSGINPDTITARTPNEFQEGVLDLLERQGIHAQGVTPEKLAHMNEYMQSQGIASGMQSGANGLEQNVVNFPQSGNFLNAEASAAQGFRIGDSGTGREQLEAWVREAERAGITFNRG